MKYQVSVPYSGYSRGDDFFIVEAGDEKEAKWKAMDYDCLEQSREVCRDDTESEWSEAEVTEVTELTQE